MLIAQRNSYKVVCLKFQECYIGFVRSLGTLYSEYKLTAFNHWWQAHFNPYVWSFWIGIYGKNVPQYLGSWTARLQKKIFFAFKNNMKIETFCE